MFKWVATFNNFLAGFAGLALVSWAGGAWAQYSYSSLSAEAQEFLRTPSFTEFSRLNSEDQLRLLERTLTRDSQIVASNGYSTLSHLLSFVSRDLKDQAYANAFSFAVLDLDGTLAAALFQHGTQGDERLSRVFVCRISSNLMGLLLTKYSGQVADVMERIGEILEGVAGHLPALADASFCDGVGAPDSIDEANQVDQGAGPSPGRGTRRSTGQSASRSVTTSCSRPQLKYYFGEAVRVLDPLPAPVWRILVIADEQCSIHGLVTKNKKGYAFTPDFGLFVRPKQPIEFSSVEQITEKLLAH